MKTWSPSRQSLMAWTTTKTKMRHTMLMDIITLLFLTVSRARGQGHVKSIEHHGVSQSSPEALTAKYFHDNLNELVHPECAMNDNTFCVIDPDYPFDTVHHAIQYHYPALAAMYKDVVATTELSVDSLATLAQEHYLCPSHVSYVKPLRAINSEGRWSVIVNGIPTHYDHLTQTARIETCVNVDSPCALVPQCYATKCVQKYAYHRFVVYRPQDYYYPFRVESFKLPSACDCLAKDFELPGRASSYPTSAAASSRLRPSTPSRSTSSDSPPVFYDNHFEHQQQIDRRFDRTQSPSDELQDEGADIDQGPQVNEEANDATHLDEAEIQSDE